MNDSDKAKEQQLIAELEALRRDNAELRQQVTEDDVSAVKRRLAVERMRAEAMAMRSSKDLLKLVGMMWEEMVNLGFETVGSSIGFVEVEEAGVHVSIRYYAIHNPRKYGISWTSPDLLEINEEVAVGETRESSPRDQMVIDSWLRGEVLSVAVRGEDLASRYKVLEESWGLDRLRPMPQGAEWILTYVPFEHGFVAFIERAKLEERLTIVREITQALSLGYIRYLDFQQLEEQNKALEENMQLLRETQNR